LLFFARIKLKRRRNRTPFRIEKQRVEIDLKQKLAIEKEENKLLKI
jgi:hypothetical protein